MTTLTYPAIPDETPPAMRLVVRHDQSVAKAHERSDVTPQVGEDEHPLNLSRTREHGLWAISG